MKNYFNNSFRLHLFAVGSYLAILFLFALIYTLTEAPTPSFYKEVVNDKYKSVHRVSFVGKPSEKLKRDLLLERIRRNKEKVIIIDGSTYQKQI